MKLQMTKPLLSLLLAFIATGCVTLENNDPLEPMNRSVYKFNDVVDKVALRPVASAYKTVTPSPIRKGINNFFNNTRTVTTVLNDILQLKFAHAVTDASRFVINSTFGLVGFIDVASMGNIPMHTEDFGQTLGHWGVGNGAYVVLPFMGPSTIRDTAGRIVDSSLSDALSYAHNIGQIRLHNQLRTAKIIDKRVELLDVTDFLGSASLDPYAFIRDAYLQGRASQVQDGLVLDDIFEPADEDL